MKTSKNWQINFIKAFYDIAGELDEYVEKELTNFGNNMYILLMVATVISVLLSVFMQGTVMQTIMIGVVLFAVYKQDQLIKRLGLDVYEISSEELPEARKKMFKRTVFQTLASAAFFVCVTFVLWESTLPQGAAITANAYFTGKASLVALGMTLIAFGLSYWTNRSKIKIVEE